MRLLKIILSTLLILAVLAAGLFYYSLNNHVSIGEYEKLYEGVDTNPNNSDIKIQFAGVSTLIISDDSTTIMTDGFFSRFPSWDMLFGEIEPQKEDIKWAVDKLAMDKLDAVLVVHSHFDHAMDAPEVAVVGNDEIQRRGDGVTVDDLFARIPGSGAELPVRYRLQENRILKNGELRYYDHPKFGVLAKVSRVEEEEDDDGVTELLGYGTE